MMPVLKPSYMQKVALSVIFLAFWIGAWAQKQYTGSYSSSEKFPLDGLVAHLDSSTKDPLLKFMSRSAKLKLLESAIDNKIETRIDFIADDTSVLVSMKVTKADPQIQFLKDNVKRYLKRKKWYLFQKKTNAFERITEVQILTCTFTGRKKKILGYTCHEALGKDESGEYILWICKTLPYTITPWVLTDKHWGAIFQLSDSLRVVRLTSLKQSTQKKRIRPLQKIKE